MYKSPVKIKFAILIQVETEFLSDGTGITCGDPHYVLKCFPPSLMTVLKIMSIILCINNCQFKNMFPSIRK
jgi:hypothetical protein